MRILTVLKYFIFQNFIRKKNFKNCANLLKASTCKGIKVFENDHIHNRAENNFRKFLVSSNVEYSRFRVECWRERPPHSGRGTDAWRKCSAPAGTVPASKDTILKLKILCIYAFRNKICTLCVSTAYIFAVS